MTAPGTAGTDPPWWHSTTIYQVYPRSFADSDGDGIGDLGGIIDHLDHIADLGVGTVWVSPFFASPQVDFGYDVTDYCDVAPDYGTLADAENLVEEAHQRGLKVMFDLVLNHTSDQHRWFRESRASRTNPRADWYIWRDGRGPGGRRKPNNWRSALEVRSAWQWGEERGQWFLATYLSCQPDLNWRNPEVKAAMFDVVRFWLDRGVDGFRLDIFGSIMKDAAFRPNPLRPGLHGGLPRVWQRRYTENTADTMALACELRAVCDEYPGPERILLGEVFGPTEVLRRYLGDGDRAGLHMVFLFELLTYRYSAEWFTRVLVDFDAGFPEPLQPTLVLENHDRSRSIDRVGGNVDRAKVLAVILLTARGVPTIYMGQEIGMSNTYIPLRDAQDPIASEFFSWVPEAVAKRLRERINRDEVRTPMQWEAGPNAGFSAAGVRTWLPVNDDHDRVNVAAQSRDEESLLSLYRRLLATRSTIPALNSGAFRVLAGMPAGVLAYERSSGSARVAVVANMGDAAAAIPVDAGSSLLCTTHGDVKLDGGQLRLARDRAGIVSLPAESGLQGRPPRLGAPEEHEMTATADGASAPLPGAWAREPLGAPLRPDSLLRKYASEPVLLAGAQRALLLQLAHAKVATGVDDHSRFRRTPIRRLFGTADKVLTIVWGDGQEPHAAWESIMEVHDRINGELHHDAGDHDQGDFYTAHDPRLLLWVWASLVDTLEIVVERYVCGFAPGEREELYGDWVSFAAYFGVPDELVPPDREAFGDYWRSMLTGGELGVSPTALSVAKSILSPPVPLVPRALKADMAALAVGLLPEAVREMYGLEWGERRQRRFRRVDGTIRALYPHLPAIRRALPPVWLGTKRALSPRWRRLYRAAA